MADYNSSHGLSCVSRIRSFQDTPGQRILPTLKKSRTIIWQSLRHYWMQLLSYRHMPLPRNTSSRPRSTKRKALHLYSKDIKANSDEGRLQCNRSTCKKSLATWIQMARIWDEKMASALLDSENQPPVIIAKSRNWNKAIDAIDNS